MLTITAFIYSVRKARCFRVYRWIVWILDVCVVLRYGLRRSRIIYNKYAAYSKSSKYKKFIMHTSQILINYRYSQFSLQYLHTRLRKILWSYPLYLSIQMMWNMFHYDWRPWKCDFNHWNKGDIGAIKGFSITSSCI